MTQRNYEKFNALIGLVPAKSSSVRDACRNWAVLHPKLASLQANEQGLKACRQMMYTELNRDGGPRFYIMDRLYKRFSNLRREMETSSMMSMLPDWE
jgi:hypothetical protein